MNAEISGSHDASDEALARSDNRWGSWRVALDYCAARPWLSFQWHRVNWLGIFIVGVGKLALIVNWPVVL